MSISINIHDPQFPAELYEIFFAKRLYTFNGNNFLFNNQPLINKLFGYSENYFQTTWQQNNKYFDKNTFESVQLVKGIFFNFWCRIVSNTKIFYEKYQKE